MAYDDLTDIGCLCHLPPDTGRSVQIRDETGGVFVGCHVNHQGIHTTNKIDKDGIGTRLVTGETDTRVTDFDPVTESRDVSMGHSHCGYSDVVLLPHRGEL